MASRDDDKDIGTCSASNQDPLADLRREKRLTYVYRKKEKQSKGMWWYERKREAVDSADSYTFPKENFYRSD